MTTHQSPETVAETLTEHDGDPVRVWLADSELVVPTEPYDGRSVCQATTSVESFEAVIDFASLEDEGMSLMGMLHLSDSEWQRIGLEHHWEHPDAYLDGEQRMLDVWASRDWDDGPESPFDRPELSVYVAKTTAAIRRGSSGLDRLTVGTIAALEPLGELDPWPTKRPGLAVEPPQTTPVSTLDEADPLDPTAQVLEALYVVNKHAKQEADRAASAYAEGRGSDARFHSLRKQALYDVKTVALHRVVVSSEAKVAFEHHTIGGDPFLCFSVDGWSFHQPLDAVDDALLERVGRETAGASDNDASIDYDRTTTVEHADCSLEAALCQFQRVGIDANEYLEQSTILDEWWSERSVEWSCLHD